MNEEQKKSAISLFNRIIRRIRNGKEKISRKLISEAMRILSAHEVKNLNAGYVGKPSKRSTSWYAYYRGDDNERIAERVGTREQAESILKVRIACRYRLLVRRRNGCISVQDKLNAKKLKKSRGRGGTYVLLDTATLEFKIGTSGDVTKRIHSIIAGHAHPLQFLGIMNITEAEAHMLLEEHRLGGEWFSWCDDVVDLVCKTCGLKGISIEVMNGNSALPRAYTLGRACLVPENTIQPGVVPGDQRKET